MWVWFWENWTRENIGCKSEDLTAPFRAGHCSPSKPTNSTSMARWDEPSLPSGCSSLPAAWERAVPVLGRKQPGYLQNTNYDLYLLSGETLSLLHPIVLLLIFTSSGDNSSQSAWKHCTAPATPCRGRRQHNPTRNKSLFWLCLGQWVSWCSDNTLVVTIMFVSMDKSGWAAPLWGCDYNTPNLGTLSTSEKPLWCKKQMGLEWKGQDHCNKTEF